MHKYPKSLIMGGMKTTGKTKKITIPVKDILIGLVILLPLFVWPHSMSVHGQYPNCTRNNGCGKDDCAENYESVSYGSNCDAPCNYPDPCPDWSFGGCILVDGCPIGCHPTYCYNDSNIEGCTGGIARHDDCTPGTHICGSCPNGEGPIPIDTSAPPASPPHLRHVCRVAGTCATHLRGVSHIIQTISV
jgi:hypothetical protein